MKTDSIAKRRSDRTWMTAESAYISDPENKESKGKDWKPEAEEDFGAMFAQAVSIACKA